MTHIQLLDPAACTPFLDRLTSVTPGFGASATSLTYRYVGDRVTEAWSVETVPKRRYAFGYDDQTNLSAVSVYDAAGTTVTSTTCLVHDGLNRLVAVGPAKLTAGPDATACRVETDVSAVQVRFRYDAQNRRIARQDGVGAWKQYAMGPDGSPLSELTRPTTSGGTWTPLRDYVWLEGKVVAQVDYPGPQVYAVHVDHLGLPRAMTGSGGTTAWSAATRPYGDLVETSATGVVTNLRLPGQYDERLLSSIGIQGPYQNWNRWYLPTMARYMELDPIAVGGGFNGASGPEWYGYANQNPPLNTDFAGLSSEMCTRSVGKYLPTPAQHCYVRFNGDKGDTLSFTPGGVGPDVNPAKPGTQCTPAGPDDKDKCLRENMQKCMNYDFTGFNCCHCVEEALKACDIRLPVDAWPNWPINPGPQPGDPGYNPKPKFP